VRSSFAPVVRKLAELFYGRGPWAADGEPVGRAGAAVLQGYSGRMLAGRDGSFVHYGAHGSPYEGAYTGLVSSPQVINAQTQIGHGQRPVVQDYPALPAGQSPAAVTDWLDQMNELQGGNPW